MKREPNADDLSRRQFLKAGVAFTASLIVSDNHQNSSLLSQTKQQDNSIADDPIYLDHTRPIEERVEDLIGRMTFDEKVSQMGSEAPAIDHLHIQQYNWWNEALHGVGRAGIATVFPQAIGLASTWNPDLIRQMATVISDEGRAKHHEAIRNDIHDIYTGLTFWSPNVNIFRDPRWGRGQETYGEDP
jgi:beta-glucosidase